MSFDSEVGMANGIEEEVSVIREYLLPLVSDLSVKINIASGFDLPKKGSVLSAGYDLVYTGVDYNLLSGETKLLSTQVLCLEVPPDFCTLVLPRSGLALKESLTVLNAPGLIDADYRGAVGVIIHNAGANPVKIQRGDRIAQLVFIRHMVPDFVVTNSFSVTDRGDQGFGSTGKRSD